jgi:hypothetical protein
MAKKKETNTKKEECRTSTKESMFWPLAGAIVMMVMPLSSCCLVALALVGTLPVGLCSGCIHVVRLGSVFNTCCAYLLGRALSLPAKIVGSRSINLMSMFMFLTIICGVCTCGCLSLWMQLIYA